MVVQFVYAHSNFHSSIRRVSLEKQMPILKILRIFYPAFFNIIHKVEDIMFCSVSLVVRRIIRHEEANKTLLDFFIWETEGICPEAGIVALDCQVTALVKHRDGVAVKRV